MRLISLSIVLTPSSNSTGISFMNTREVKKTHRDQYGIRFDMLSINCFNIVFSTAIIFNKYCLSLTCLNEQCRYEFRYG